MSAHDAIVVWRREGDFLAGRYSRAHEWHFDGGLTVPGSASPSVVRPPLSREDAVDPEEAFVAALASCHMLWFLDLARHAGFAVEAYRDEASGTMGRLASGRYWLERVTLRPRVVFAGEAPDAETFNKLHEDAHERCFIANSVKTELALEPLVVSHITESAEA
ncbi:OsmC family protein [Lutibaculum baratangense]|uniref:OsmC/Ohr family protein n=1 Tax=Lutibaculum baratangense AMV1 TaxID=631454 RepID=V4TK09_9HYPH|nr:OsmC family protein [Lutibaculum baratangense]ESR26228.1 OsmC/Ohr family protein [Lutibaculum baratangense AMV1]